MEDLLPASQLLLIIKEQYYLLIRSGEILLPQNVKEDIAAYEAIIFSEQATQRALEYFKMKSQMGSFSTRPRQVAKALGWIAQGDSNE